ncbi:MAG: MBL fold metallo-hydrolase [Bacteroidales bacterium]
MTYIIHEDDGKEAYLIDCGDIKPISDYLKENGLKLKGVFLTHSHFDHIYGLNRMTKKYPEVKVYTNEAGKDGLQSPKLNMSRYHEDVDDFIFTKQENVEVIGVGTLELSSINSHLSTIYTPGHDESCLTYQIEKYLFTGDSFIPGTKTITSFPRSNKQNAKVSEQRICQFTEGTIICPGHSTI